MILPYNESVTITLQKLQADNYSHFLKWWRDKELISLTSGDFAPMSDEEIQKQVAEIANDRNAHHWMIDVNDIPVGHINLSKIDDQTSELQIVIGEKEYWGKGIGSTAIKLVFDKANNLGYTKILAEVRPNNIRAINLYQKVGFQKQDLKNYPENPNLPEVILMTKELVNSY